VSKSSWYITLSFLTIITTSAFADQLVLTNGDHISGTILKSDGKALTLKTDFAGEIDIKWSAIEQIQSNQTLHVDLKNGQKPVGTVTTSDGKLAVATASNGTITVAKEDVAALRNPDEEAAFDISQHPRLTQGWAGGANVGFALTAGNSQTKNLALAFTADRKSVNDHVALYANSVYATSSGAGLNATTANSIQSGVRYERNITTRTFGFVSSDFQTDALQSLDLRSVIGAGLGFHAIKSGRTGLDFLAGANYTRETYTTLQRNVAALTLGEELSRQLAKSTLLVQKLYFFPALNEAGEYRATFNFGTVTKISKWLGWQNAFGDIYVTNPPAGKKKNDITFTTGLNVAFGPTAR